MNKTIIIISIIILSGCRSTGEATEVYTLTPSDQAPIPITRDEVLNPTNTYILKPTTTPTTPFTPTPFITKTPIPIDADPISSDGPWLLIKFDYGIWAIDPDGGGISHILDFHPVRWQFVKIYPAPNGGKVALVQTEDQIYIPPDLNLIIFPSGKITKITQMISDQYHVEQSEETTGDWLDYNQTFIAVETTGGWSEDGLKFVFSGAIEGPSADLYLYSVPEGQITRLTSEDTHAVDVVWSPDNSHILYTGVTSLNWGASGYGYSDNVVWLVNTETSANTKLFQGISYGFENHLGWLTPDTYLADTGELPIFNFNLRIIDLDGNIEKVLTCENYDDRIFDPISKFLLITIRSADPLFNPDIEACDGPQEVGHYLYSLADGKFELVYYSPWVDYSREPVYIEEAGLFFIPEEENYIVFDRTGNRNPSPITYPERTVFAPNGREYYLIREDKVFFAGNWIDIKNQNFLSDDPFPAVWRPDGKALFMFTVSSDNQYFNLYLAEAPKFIPYFVTGFPIYHDGVPSRPPEFYWVMP